VARESAPTTHDCQAGPLIPPVLPYISVIQAQKEDIADPAGRFDIPSGRTNKPDPEITKALKGRWIAVDRNTLSPELQALVNDAKVDGILENRTQRREKALAELQQGKKDRIAAEAGAKA
jgi:hypothetical protein